MLVERARRHAVGGCLACVAGFSLVLVLAYWVGPAERLDRSILDALSTPTDTLVNEVAYAGFLAVNFRWFFLLAALPSSEPSPERHHFAAKTRGAGASSQSA